MARTKKRKTKHEKKIERSVRYHFPEETWINILSFISFDIINQKPFKKYPPIRTIKSLLCVSRRFSQIFQYIFENDIKKKFNIDKNILWFLLFNLGKKNVMDN